MDNRMKMTLFILLGLIAVSYIVSFFFGTNDTLGTENVALIKIDKPILLGQSGIFGDEFITSDEIIGFIDDANKKENIKAIIFEINSPGGSAVASAEVSLAVQKINKTKVAWVREVGASGAYWIASSTDAIVAHPLSLVGSIGVISSYVDVSGLLTRYNVTYNRLVAGKYKDMGTPLKQLTDEERSLFQTKLDKIHTVFIQNVAVNRHLSEEYVRNLSTGEVYLGTEAKDLGLIDVLGGKEEATLLVKEKANLTEVSLVEYHKEKSFLETVAGLMSQQSFHVGEGIASFFMKSEMSVKT